MEFKLYPHPIRDVYTPFTYVSEQDIYSRYCFTDSTPSLVSIVSDPVTFIVDVVGIDKKAVIGTRLPDRKAVLDYLLGHEAINRDFLKYAQSHIIVPVFPLSHEEAFVKTVIRQIISAKHAKRIFSDFVKRFGYEKNGVYGFPSLQQLREVSVHELKTMGLGFKAERIHAGLRAFEQLGELEGVTSLSGIGPWSKSILQVELHKDYSFYPFWDKSGEKIRKVCCVDLIRLAHENRVLAGDVYIYAASYTEAIRAK